MKWMVFVVLLTWRTIAGAQEYKYSWPKIGEKIPDHTFTELVNFPAKQASINDFRGKWLLLDFWAVTCGACLISFPKMNRLHEHFKDRMQLIMVGTHEGRDGQYASEQKTKKLYERLSGLYQLKFTVAFDSVLYYKFDVHGLPHIIIVDPEGIVRAKTIDVDSARLAELFEGGSPFFTYNYSQHEKRPDSRYKPDLPFLTNGVEANGGTDTAFVFRSMISKWTPQTPDYMYHGFGELIQKKGQAEAFGMDIPKLLRIAYTGVDHWDSTLPQYDTLYRQVIVETKDTSLFADRDANTGVNMYNYSLKAHPDASPEEMREYLLQDLQRYFGFTSSLEYREVPVWELVVIDGKKADKLRTKGGKTESYLTDDGGYRCRNCTVETLIKYSYLNSKVLKTQYPGSEAVLPPLLDKTGITCQIDITLDAYPNNFESVKKELNSYGLDLVKGTAKRKCIVVK